MEISGIDNIKRYLRLISSKKYIFIIASILLTTIFLIYVYSIPKNYTAKSTILLEDNIIEKFVKGIAITPTIKERIKAMSETILGRGLILKTIRKLNLDSGVKTDKDLEEMIFNFQKKTKLKIRKDRSFVLSFTSEHPVHSRDYVNTLVRLYIEDNIIMKKLEADSATKFLRKQVGFFKEKKDRAENAIIKYRQEKGIYIAVDENSLIEEIKGHNQGIEEIKTERSQLIAAKDSLRSRLKGEPVTVNVLDTSEFLDSKNKMIESLENRIKKLLIIYTEEYPEVIKLRDETAALKRQGYFTEYPNSLTDSETGEINPIYQGIKQKIIELEAEISAINAKEKNLKGLMKDKEKQLRYIPEDKKKLADLEKDRDAFKGTYKQLLGRLGQAEVSKQMEIEDKAATFRVIEPAVSSTRPDGPGRKKLILVSVMFGLLGGFGFVYLRDSFDKSVKSIDDIKILGLPVLATIPKIQSAENLIKIRKKDKLLYSFAGVYMLGILGLFTLEYMGLTFVDDFARQYLVTIKDTIRGIF